MRQRQPVVSYSPMDPQSHFLTQMNLTIFHKYCSLCVAYFFYTCRLNRRYFCAVQRPFSCYGMSVNGLRRAVSQGVV
ncbi:hypothetical protein CPC08DRAFT_365954 [Agrocybe pediades]|nr:hypothetical protein CPC08DRAFT_365954 [Agrocybe pediades]